MGGNSARVRNVWVELLVHRSNYHNNTFYAFLRQFKENFIEVFFFFLKKSRTTSIKLSLIRLKRRSMSFCENCYMWKFSNQKLESWIFKVSYNLQKSWLFSENSFCLYLRFFKSSKSFHIVFLWYFPDVNWLLLKVQKTPFLKHPNDDQITVYVPK